MHGTAEKIIRRLNFFIAWLELGRKEILWLKKKLIQKFFLGGGDTNWRAATWKIESWMEERDYKCCTPGRSTRILPRRSLFWKCRTISRCINKSFTPVTKLWLSQRPCTWNLSLFSLCMYRAFCINLLYLSNKFTVHCNYCTAVAVMFVSSHCTVRFVLFTVVCNDSLIL
jgi:hypothetical protein